MVVVIIVCVCGIVQLTASKFTVTVFLIVSMYTNLNFSLVFATAKGFKLIGQQCQHLFELCSSEFLNSVLLSVIVH